MSQEIRAPQWSRPASVEIGEVPLEGVPLDSWLPGFPDFPGQQARRVPAFPAFVFPEIPLAPPLSWSPIFADFARAAQRTAWYQFVAHTNALPNFTVPALSWKPFFDDFARRAARVVEFPFGGFNPTRALPETDLSWKPVFDDFARAKARVVQFPFGGYTESLPNYAIPNLAWDPRFPDFPGRAALRVAQFPFLAYTDATPDIPSNNLSWHPSFDDFARSARRSSDFPFGGYTNATPDLPESNLAWHPVFDDFARARLPNNAPFFPASFFPIPIVLRGNRTLVIHTPDEIPIGAPRKFSVEWDVDGTAVPLDAPPTMRIYHLDANGFQVTDLATGACAVYPSGTAYFRTWTPADRGVYIIEIIGTFEAAPLIYVLPVTVRAKFDPFALANDDVLVSRNGDIGD